MAVNPKTTNRTWYTSAQISEPVIWTTIYQTCYSSNTNVTLHYQHLTDCSYQIAFGKSLYAQVIVHRARLSALPSVKQA